MVLIALGSPRGVATMHDRDVRDCCSRMVSAPLAHANSADAWQGSGPTSSLALVIWRRHSANRGRRSDVYCVERRAGSSQKHYRSDEAVERSRASSQRP